MKLMTTSGASTDDNRVLLLCYVLFYRYFISKGAVVDKIGGDLKSTPLHWATRLEHVHNVSML